MIDFLFQGIFDFCRSSLDIAYPFAFVVAVFLLLSGLDDILLDLYYWFLYTFSPRHLNKYRSERREKLYRTAEKPIAIFVPAWHEFDVIDRMLVNTCTTLQYYHYDIFVGVYPNDPKTIAQVKKVTEKYPQVHMVVSSHPGPSTKAENLNEIHQGMLKWENLSGIRYDIIVMHDAEDVIHPMSLKIHNYFIPNYDMVQLPVFPLEMNHRKITHWIYADEFAEAHTKDMMARQLFSKFVPSAGVGTGYNRWLIEFIGTSFARNIFRRASLTEDYDIALRLALGEAKLLFVYKPFGINVATRAFFPTTFTASIRQRTRWLIGICLQSWSNIGWIGNWRFRLALYRDRKAVLTNMVNALAYSVLFYVLLYEAVRYGLTQYGTLPSLINPGDPLYTIVLIDTIFMVWRFVHRFLTVTRIYGALAGLFSVLRLPIGNFVNFMATVRGVNQYFSSKRNGRRVAWDKTTHAFPSAVHPVAKQM